MWLEKASSEEINETREIQTMAALCTLITITNMFVLCLEAFLLFKLVIAGSPGSISLDLFDVLDRRYCWDEMPKFHIKQHRRGPGRFRRWTLCNSISPGYRESRNLWKRLCFCSAKACCKKLKPTENKIMRQTRPDEGYAQAEDARL